MRNLLKMSKLNYLIVNQHFTKIFKAFKGLKNCKVSLNFATFLMNCRKVNSVAAFGGVLVFCKKNKPCFLQQNDKKSAFILASFLSRC